MSTKGYRKKPVVIQATQWFKNGDHPEDYAAPREGLETRDGKQELISFSGEYARQHLWEGGIVRYFRRPDVPGPRACKHCGNTMHVHGWIDTLEGGHTVCPGDWIITGVKGEHYPCKPDIFAATYEPAALRTPTEQPPEGETPDYKRMHQEDHNTIVNLRTERNAARSEVEEFGKRWQDAESELAGLKHDIARAVQTNSELLAEVERLRGESGTPLLWNVVCMQSQDERGDVWQSQWRDVLAAAEQHCQRAGYGASPTAAPEAQGAK